MIHTLFDAKFHGTADGIYCRAIGASVFELWIRYVKGLCVPSPKVSLQGRFCPNGLVPE